MMVIKSYLVPSDGVPYDTCHFLAHARNGLEFVPADATMGRPYVFPAGKEMEAVGKKCPNRHTNLRTLRFRHLTFSLHHLLHVTHNFLSFFLNSTFIQSISWTTMLKTEILNAYPHHSNYDLAGPLGPLVPASLADHGEVTNKIPPLPFVTQKQIAKSEYMKLRGKKMIDVFHLSTYQGRSKSKDSTNGCTVISPLVAVHHLNSDGSGISDFKIEQIIDEIAPSILSRVRNKLGLAPYALIIPSDVHDYLVDEKILKQEMFVGVCGGNVLDEDHVNEFLNLLENGHDSNPTDGVEEKKDASRKVAAALFFHEHVVSILKVVLADGTTWYDLVDSLPSRNEEKIGATRTRCKDRQSLEALLRWYACGKFSSADAKYIDSNEWDDNMCDFDPRVFQGFVWKE